MLEKCQKGVRLTLYCYLPLSFSCHFSAFPPVNLASACGMWNRSGYSSYRVHRLDLFNFVDMDRRACRLFAVHVGVDVHLGHQRLTMFEVGKDSAADAKRCLRMEHPSVDSFSKHHNLLSKVSVSSAHAARRLMQNTYHCRDCHFFTATRAAAFAALPNVNAGRGCAAAAFVAPPKGRPRLFLAPAPRVSAGHEAEPTRSSRRLPNRAPGDTNNA